jgi:heme-degrading monooxygenase HmoA
MPVIRVIYVTFPPDQADTAERNWKESCAPIMIRQPGCLWEEMLRCKENPGEYISYSEWDNWGSIQNYLASEDHQEIKRHNRNITGAKVEVKHYELVAKREAEPPRNLKR